MEGKKAKSTFCWKKPSTMSTERTAKEKDEKHNEEAASEPTSSKIETVKCTCSPPTASVQAAASEASPPTLQSDLHQKLTAQRHDDSTDDDISDGWSDADDYNPSQGMPTETTPNLIISTLQKKARHGPVSYSLPCTPSDWKLPDDYPRISLLPEVMKGIEGCQRIMDSFWEEFYAKSSPHTSPIVSFYSMKSTTGLQKTSSRASRFHAQQKCTIS